MKRLIPLLLSLLLLCGCGIPGEVSPTAEPVPPVKEAPTEPAGLYDPESPLEAATDGALKVYPLNQTDTQSVVPFGSDLLLFTTGEYTTLTKLSGSTLYPTASAALDCAVYLEDPAVQVSEKGVTYYDTIRQELVFLDTGLKEANRVSMPDSIIGRPALSEDRKTLYYFTADSLRVLDLESGIDRLLKEMSFHQQSLVALHCDDSIVECSVGDEDGNWYHLYLAASTGELLWERCDYLALYTEGDRYFAAGMDGTYREMLTGTAGGDVQMIHCPDSQADAFPVLERSGVITATETEGAIILDYYDLDYGIRPYSISLPLRYMPWSIAADPAEDCLWLLCYDDGYGCDILCRWEPEKSPVEDDTVYIGIRRTAENPDIYGLEECAQLADRLSKKHGVRILIWTDAAAVQPWDYTFIPEYQVPPIREALDVLDTALSNFPAGFFKEAASELGDGTLRIALVRSIRGIQSTGAPETAAGVQFWSDEGNAYICVELGIRFEPHLYHELFHIIESRVFSLSSAFDNWEDLNPEGFEYDYSYTKYEFREDLSLIGGQTRAFIDYYAMTYPTEDRARIMEYAMMSGNEEFFTSAIMQSKLRTICEGLREAYGLENSAEIFLWEQYLAAE